MGRGKQGLGLAGDNYGALEAGKLVFHASSANTMEHTQVGRGSDGDGDEDGVEHGLDWVGLGWGKGCSWSWVLFYGGWHLHMIIYSRLSPPERHREEQGRQGYSCNRCYVFLDWAFAFN